jgi:hypothetical protein
MVASCEQKQKTCNNDMASREEYPPLKYYYKAFGHHIISARITLIYFKQNSGRKYDGGYT